MSSICKLAMDIDAGARAAHAFIIEGRAGEARGAFIRKLASCLECSAAEPAARPCGCCPSCRQIAAGTSLDIVIMNKSVSSGRKAKASYKTEDAAAFMERLNMGAYGRYLVGIIEDGDSLSEVVQNKLLKTLEEPGRDTIILIAASNRDRLLDTIRSRCSCIRMDGFEEDAPGSEVSGDEDRFSKLAGLSRMLISGVCAFHEFREAVDKDVRSGEDALAVLEMTEDDLRAGMVESEAANSANFAHCIELVNIARMDIRRDMNCQKALRRLFLELH